MSPSLRAECNTARVGSDKSIGLQAILNGNGANKLGGSHCADLTAPPRSVPSLFDSIAQNKAQNSSPKGGREGKNFTRIICWALTLLNNRTQVNSEQLF